MNPSRFAQILQAIIGAEATLVPIFVHNPQSQNIAAVIIAAESEVGGLLGSVLGMKVVAPAATTGN